MIYKIKLINFVKLFIEVKIIINFETKILNF